jgi:hypothetical protein
MIRKSNWHDRWITRWKAARGDGPRPAPKLRAKDPRLPPDVFWEPYTLDDVAGIIDATKAPLAPGYSADMLRRKLNVAAIYWFAESRAAARHKGRGNPERANFLWKKLGGIFEEAFGKPAAARPTIRTNYPDGEKDWRIDSPFVRFVRRALATLDYPISGGALYDLKREKKPTKKKRAKRR